MRGWPCSDIALRSSWLGIASGVMIVTLFDCLRASQWWAAAALAVAIVVSITLTCRLCITPAVELDAKLESPIRVEINGLGCDVDVSHARLVANDLLDSADRLVEAAALAELRQSRAS